MSLQEKIKMKLCSYYDIQEEFSVGAESYPFMATYHDRSAKYILNKKYEYYAFTNHQYIFYQNSQQELTEEWFSKLQKNFEMLSEKVVKKEENHMSSSIILVLEAPLPKEKNMKKKVHNFRYYKSFRWGFGGWIHGGIVLMDPEGKQGLSNRYARKELNNFLVRGNDIL